MSKTRELFVKALNESIGASKIQWKDEKVLIESKIDKQFDEAFDIKSLLVEVNTKLDRYYIQEAEKLALLTLNTLQKYYLYLNNLYKGKKEEYQLIQSNFYKELDLVAAPIDKRFAAINTKEKILALYVLDQNNTINSAIYSSIFMNKLNLFKGIRILLHEFVHYFDALMRKGNGTFKYNPKEPSETLADPKTIKYFNQKDEINAYTKEIEKEIENIFTSITNDILKSNPKIKVEEVFSKVFHEALKEIFKTHLTLNGFVTALYPRNKQHLYKALFFYTKELLIQNYGIYSILSESFY